MFLIHATQEADSILPPTADERLAAWARKYFGNGHHHRREKPRIKVHVPAPLSNTQPGEPGEESEA